MPVTTGILAQHFSAKMSSWNLQTCPRNGPPASPRNPRGTSALIFSSAASCPSDLGSLCGEKAAAVFACLCFSFLSCLCLFVCLIVCLFVCLIVCLFVCLFGCLLVCFFVYVLLVYMIACLFACLCVCLFVCLFFVLQSVSLFLCLLFLCVFVSFLD